MNDNDLAKRTENGCSEVLGEPTNHQNIIRFQSKADLNALFVEIAEIWHASDLQSIADKQKPVGKRVMTASYAKYLKSAIRCPFYFVQLPYCWDAAYFLVYGTVVEGLATAGGTLSTKAKVSRMVMSGENLVLASLQYAPINLSMQPVFNATNGYINYIVPAVFVLILHQTLLIAAGLLGGEQNEKRKIDQSGYWRECHPFDLWSARTVILFLTYIPLVMYYFGFSFEFYGISKLASISPLLAMIFPFFLLAVIFTGMVIGELVPRREIATVIVVLVLYPWSFVPVLCSQLTQSYPPY